MPKPRSFLRIFTEACPLVALTVAIALLIGIVAPASAQIINFPGFGGGPPQRQAPQRDRGGGGGWFGGDFFATFQERQPHQAQRPREECSRVLAPA